MESFMFSEDLGGSVLESLTALGETDLSFVQQRNGGQGADAQGVSMQPGQHQQGMSAQPQSDQSYFHQGMKAPGQMYDGAGATGGHYGDGSMGMGQQATSSYHMNVQSSNYMQPGVYPNSSMSQQQQPQQQQQQAARAQQPAGPGGGAAPSYWHDGNQQHAMAAGYGMQQQQAPQQPMGAPHHHQPPGGSSMYPGQMHGQDWQQQARMNQPPQQHMYPGMAGGANYRPGQPYYGASRPMAPGQPMGPHATGAGMRQPYMVPEHQPTGPGPGQPTPQAPQQSQYPMMGNAGPGGYPQNIALPKQSPNQADYYNRMAPQRFPRYPGAQQLNGPQPQQMYPVPPNTSSIPRHMQPPGHVMPPQMQQRGVVPPQLSPVPMAPKQPGPMPPHMRMPQPGMQSGQGGMQPQGQPGMPPQGQPGMQQGPMSQPGVPPQPGMQQGPGMSQVAPGPRAAQPSLMSPQQMQSQMPGGMPMVRPGQPQGPMGGVPGGGSQQMPGGMHQQHPVMNYPNAMSMPGQGFPQQNPPQSQNPPNTGYQMPNAPQQVAVSKMSPSYAYQANSQYSHIQSFPQHQAQNNPVQMQQQGYMSSADLVPLPSRSPIVSNAPMPAPMASTPSPANVGGMVSQQQHHDTTNLFSSGPSPDRLGSLSMYPPVSEPDGMMSQPSSLQQLKKMVEPIQLGSPMSSRVMDNDPCNSAMSSPQMAPGSAGFQPHSPANLPLSPMPNRMPLGGASPGHQQQQVWASQHIQKSAVGSVASSPGAVSLPSPRQAPTPPVKMPMGPSTPVAMPMSTPPMMMPPETHRSPMHESQIHTSGALMPQRPSVQQPSPLAVAPPEPQPEMQKMSFNEQLSEQSSLGFGSSIEMPTPPIAEPVGFSGEQQRVQLLEQQPQKEQQLDLGGSNSSSDVLSGFEQSASSLTLPTPDPVPSAADLTDQDQQQSVIAQLTSDEPISTPPPPVVPPGPSLQLNSQPSPVQQLPQPAAESPVTQQAASEQQKDVVIMPPPSGPQGSPMAPPTGPLGQPMPPQSQMAPPIQPGQMPMPPSSAMGPPAMGPSSGPEYPSMANGPYPGSYGPGSHYNQGMPPPAPPPPTPFGYPQQPPQAMSHPQQMSGGWAQPGPLYQGPPGPSYPMGPSPGLGPESHLVMQPPLEALVMDEGGKKKKAPARPKKPKVPKDPSEVKEPKEKKPRTPRPKKEPKEPKEPKPPKAPKPPKEPKEAKPKTPKKPRPPRKKKGDSDMPSVDLGAELRSEDAGEGTESGPDGTPVKAEGETGEMPATEGFDEPVAGPSGVNVSGGESAEAKPKKPKRLRVKEVSSKKKKPTKTLLSFSKKKRKRTSGSDVSDMEGTPPPSPEDDDNSNKRRSARNTKRKKYVDEVDLNLSDEDAAPRRRASKQGGKAEVVEEVATESAKPPEEEETGEQELHKPRYAYINPSAEDAMVVQFILAVRMGKREIDSDDEDEDEDAEKKKEGDEPKPGHSAEAKPAETAGDESQKPETEAQLAGEQESKAKPEESKAVETKVNGEGEDAISSDQKEESLQPSEQAKVGDQQAPAKPKKEPKMIDVEEYLVKYKNFSYIHCEWKTEEELLKGDKRFPQKIKRFQQKMSSSHNIFDFLDEEPFNPDYVEVDRVLDVSKYTDPQTKETVKHYLVKWKSLPYEDSTWELEDDVDPNKIKQFMQFRDPPKSKSNKKPKPSDWKKLDESPVYKAGNRLREYQLEGINWLQFSWFNGRNCILADEMGLGKTVQSITFLQAVHDYGVKGPYLIIAPLSTIPNWQREFETWTDINVIVYHGSSASRSMIMEYEMYYRDANGQKIEGMYKFESLITTFEVIISDCLELREIPWKCCIIDEAHRLKNKNCKLLEGLRLLKLDHRVLLSGTPLQNSIMELYSLLNFLEPAQFASSEEFLTEFGELRTDEQVQKLHALLKPMMLRRLKGDVEKSIAPKEETIIEVELTNMQKKYYRAILEKNFTFLSKGSSGGNVPNLMNTMMELRKCCIHPFLINGAEEAILDEFRRDRRVSADEGSYYDALVQSSGKLVLVDKLLPKLKSSGHRVLIFSQMVRCLDILEDYLIHRKYPFERIDGRIRGNIRQAAIDRFCKPDSDRFVFLLCTKAGGLGINLTAADTVIIYDSDWNPQNDLQAQARCHRIGQQKMVKVYRLICRNTYEREMFDRASLKLGLDKAILQSMNTTQKISATGVTTTGPALSKKEVEELLRKGAYGALMDDDGAGDNFCEEDIDQILERRTQVITVAQDTGSSFSKASFAHTENRSDIDVDDPDFWQKWARKADIDTEIDKKELIMDTPRKRTQTRRFGNDEPVMDISDLESSEDSDEGGMTTRRGRPLRQTRSGRRGGDEEDPSYDSRWTKSDCIQVEKMLLTWGWGRWLDALKNGRHRRAWKEFEIEDCARLIILYCLHVYRGDEKIKAFIWDLIAPNKDEASAPITGNHEGLSSPVPRGRKGRRKSKERTDQEVVVPGTDWSQEEKYDPEVFLDGSYKRHLNRQANKVLLRVRMLYYIKQEIVGPAMKEILQNLPVQELPVYPPPCDLPPEPWWDAECDKSLLVGVYKHGYEKFNSMRMDPTLIFLSKIGPPDSTELLAEASRAEAALDDGADEGDDDEDKDVEGKHDGDFASRADKDDASVASGSTMKWPTPADLNTRLRRLVTCYQRSHKREEQKMQQKVKRLEKQERMEVIVREREAKRVEQQQRRWSKREEAEFYRAISSFGLEYNRAKTCYDWARFRHLSNLERKPDEALNEYLRGFLAMCKRVTGHKLTEEEDLLQMSVEPITEERAQKLLERLDFMTKLREHVIHRPNLLDRLMDIPCPPSSHLPSWWIPVKHDRDLLVGVARYGLSRPDYFMITDPTLSFKDIVQRYMAGKSLVDEAEKKEWEKRISKLVEAKTGKGRKSGESPKKKGEDSEKPDEEPKAEPEEEAKAEETGDVEKEKAAEEEEEEEEAADGEKKKAVEEKDATEAIDTSEEADKKPEEAESPAEVVVKPGEDEEKVAEKEPPPAEVKPEKTDESPGEEAQEIPCDDKPDDEPTEEDKSEEKIPESETEEEKPESMEAEPAETVVCEKEKPEEKAVEESEDKEEEEEAKPLELKVERKEDKSEDKPEIAVVEVKSSPESISRSETPLPAQQGRPARPAASSPYGLNMDYRAYMGVQGFAPDSAMAHLMSQTYANPIQFPKDRVILWRVESLVGALDKGKWPDIKLEQVTVVKEENIVLTQRVATPDPVSGLPPVPLPVNHDANAMLGMFRPSPTPSPSVGRQTETTLLRGGSTPLSITPVSSASSKFFSPHGAMPPLTSQASSRLGHDAQSHLTHALRGVGSGGRSSPNLQALAQSADKGKQLGQHSSLGLDGSTDGRRKRTTQIDVDIERAKLQALLQMHNLPPSLSLTLAKPARDAADDMTSVLQNALRRGASSSSLGGVDLTASLMKAPPPPAHQLSRSQSTSGSARQSSGSSTGSREGDRALRKSLAGSNLLALTANPFENLGSMDLSRRSSTSKTPSPAPSPSPVQGSAAPASPIDLSGPSKSQTEEKESSDKLVLDLQARSKKAGGLSSLELTLNKIRKRKMEQEQAVQESKRKKLDSIVKGLSGKAVDKDLPSSSKSAGIMSSLLLEAEMKHRRQTETKDGALNLSEKPDAWNASRKSKEPNDGEGRDKGRLPPFCRADITITPIPPKTSTASGLSMTTTSYSQKQDSQDKKVHRWLEQMGSSPWDYGKASRTAPSPGPSTSGSQKPQQQSALRQRLNASPARSGGPSPGPSTSSGAGTSSGADWTKTNPDEVVPIVCRISGKKPAGVTPPLFKNLSRWLVENPNYDVDPEWRKARNGRGVPDSLSKQLSKETELALLSQAAAAAGFPGLLNPSDAKSAANAAALAAAAQYNFGMAGMNAALMNNPLMAANLGAFGMGGLPYGAGDMSAYSAFSPEMMALFAAMTTPGLGTPGVSGSSSSSTPKEKTSRGGRPSTSQSSSGGQSSSSRQESKQAAANAAANAAAAAALGSYPFFFQNPAAASFMGYPHLMGFAGLGQPTTMSGAVSSSFSTVTSSSSIPNGMRTTAGSSSTSSVPSGSASGFPPGFAEAFASQVRHVPEVVPSHGLAAAARTTTRRARGPDQPSKTSSSLHSQLPPLAVPGRSESSLGHSSSASSPASAISPASSARLGAASPAGEQRSSSRASSVHGSHLEEEKKRKPSPAPSTSSVGSHKKDLLRAHSKPRKDHDDDARSVKSAASTKEDKEERTAAEVEEPKEEEPSKEPEQEHEHDGPRKRELRSSTSAQSAAVAPPPVRRRRPSKPKERPQSGRPKEAKLEKLPEEEQELEEPAQEHHEEHEQAEEHAETEHKPEAHGSSRRKRDREREPEPKLRSSSRTAAAVANVKMSSLVDTRVPSSDSKKSDAKTRKHHPSDEEPLGSPKSKRSKPVDDER